ncbi:MAG: ABC transporter permease [Anaerolineae bacterium]|nr:ABC transporter permease [Anaerolineae bacterium]
MTRKIAWIWLFLMFGMVIFGAFLTPYDPMVSHGGAQPPNSDHFLGTDGLGRDVFSRLLAGASRTLGFSAFSTLIALFLGGFLGMVAPLIGKWGDNTLVLVMNTLLTFPPLILALVLLTLFGRGDVSLIVAVGLGQVGMTAHIIRGATRIILAEEYITSARALGANRLHIIIVHIRRGIMPTFGAQLGIVFGYCLFNSAALNFLGLGVGIGVPEWGAMLAEGRAVFSNAPHVAIFTGLLLMSVVMCVNQLADAD